jgi:uncharacterized metal-binding protein
MNTQPQCTCQAAPKLIFPCSGASDVGGLADRAARALSLTGAGRMYCLAGIGGRVEGILATTRAAASVLVIDGCRQECARKTMELAGIQRFQHLRLVDLGLEKGRTPLTAARIRKVAAVGAGLLGVPGSSQPISRSQTQTSNQ